MNRNANMFGWMQRLALRAGVWLFLVIVLAGCRSTGGSRKFPDIGIPGNGGPVDRAAWTDAESWREHGMPDKYWKTNWMLPFTIVRKQAAFDNPEQLTVRSLVHNDLGAPLIFLPLRFKASRYIYTPDQEEPVRGDWGSWTLFWASDGTVGGGIPGREVSASGVPLFYGNFKVTEEKDRTQVVNTLWSLGPAYATFHAEAEQADTMAEHANRSVSASAFAPVALTGAPGVLLWWDCTVRTRTADRMTRLDAHGPLAGTLGVLQSYSEHGEGRELLRLVTLGILWRDQYFLDDGSSTGANSAHGPLWAAFGWGRKNGRPAIRLFFVPIVLPGGEDNSNQETA